MSDNSLKSEGSAYLTAIAIREQFHPEAGDFLPVHLDESLSKYGVMKKQLEACLEKINDDELRKELTPIHREVQGYWLMLKTLVETREGQPGKWSLYQYYLDPQSQDDVPPHLEAKEVRKHLSRMAGFGDITRAIFDQNFAARDRYEQEKLFSSHTRLKSSPGGNKTKGGWLSKLGFG